MLVSGQYEHSGSKIEALQIAPPAPKWRISWKQALTIFIPFQWFTRNWYPQESAGTHTSLYNVRPAVVYLSMAVQPFVGPWPLFTFLIFYSR
jgi:hypothetical protein